MKADLADSLSILGTQVGAFDSPDAVLELIRRRIMANERTFCVAINPEKVYRARHDSRLRNILESADVRICDGVGISLAAILCRRVPGAHEPTPRSEDCWKPVWVLQDLSGSCGGNQ